MSKYIPQSSAWRVFSTIISRMTRPGEIVSLHLHSNVQLASFSVLNNLNSPSHKPCVCRPQSPYNRTAWQNTESEKTNLVVTIVFSKLCGEMWILVGNKPHLRLTDVHVLLSASVSASSFKAPFSLFFTTMTPGWSTSIGRSAWMTKAHGFIYYKTIIYIVYTYHAHLCKHCLNRFPSEVGLCHTDI